MKLTDADLSQIAACPSCHVPLKLTSGSDAHCSGCHAKYRSLPHSWELIPDSWKATSDLWSDWEVLQHNGVVSYTQDTTHNLAVGERSDCIEFSKFCDFDGMVLDVGCGPQPWPAHFARYSDSTHFIGVDPLVGEIDARYTQIRALAEFLPFRNEVFDQVTFTTSLDHMIDPVVVLRESLRVCRPDGELIIWIGEKNPDAPRPQTSPEWYSNLKKPVSAEDVFHFKRLSSAELRLIFQKAGLVIRKEEIHPVDKYRNNFFFKLASATDS